MKNSIIFYLALLCLGIKMSFGQSNPLFANINFPVDGTIFQKNSSGQYSLNFAGQFRPVSGYTYTYRLTKKDSPVLLTYTTVFSGSIDLTNSITVNGDGTTNFIMNSFPNSLDKGWYRLSILVHPNIFPSAKLPISIVQFGVGDVYFITGQSNAAGYNYQSAAISTASSNSTNFDYSYDWTGIDDATIPFLNNGASSLFNVMTRTFNFNGKYEWFDSRANRNSKRPKDGIWEGLPYKSRFDVLKNGTDKITDRVRLYPNGMASWCWAPLGLKIAILQSTPTLFFNAAFPGSSLIHGWLPTNNSIVNEGNETKKFLETLSMYGGVLGAKSVLWHQGEEDAVNLSDHFGSQPFVINDYETKLNLLINKSREKLSQNANNNHLSWYVSKVSYFTSYAGLSNSTTPSGTSGLLSGGLFTSGYSHNFGANGTRQWTNFYTHTEILARQDNVEDVSKKIYYGISSDNITNDSRDNKFHVHFSGDKTHNGINSIQEVADRWYAAIYNNYSSNSISPTVPLKITYVNKNSNTSWRIDLENHSNYEYYWVRNSNGIYKDPSNSNVKSYENSNPMGEYFYTFSNVADGDILTCYVKDNNGRFHASQPVLAQYSNSSGKVLEVSTQNLNFSQTGETKDISLIFNGVVWEVSSKPAWISSVELIQSDSDLLRIVAPNNNGSSQSGNIILSELNGGITKTIAVSQSGASSTTTSLTSLNPTSTSGSYRINKSADNNTLQIAGTQYTQGIGVHANSSLTYSLDGQYNTFNFKIGQDDESNCGDGVQFSIKADGVTIYGPVTKTYGQAATAQSVSVSGKNNLELIVNMGANNYCDHGDWVDLYLSTTSGGGGCTTQPTLPTNVYASAGEVSSGGSATLYATCATGTPLWSNQATGSAITVNPTATTNYTVKCTASNCTPSSEVGLYVVVPSSGSCSSLTNNQTLGTWNVPNPGHPLMVKTFYNQKWLVQRISTSPEEFLVRGSEMLTRGDVSPQYAYSSYVGCFAWTYSNYGGLATPAVQTQFQTPSGYQQLYEGDGTPYYRYIGGARKSAPDSIIEEQDFIKIVPNPNSGEFSVVVDLADDSPLDLSLINSSGVVFETMNFEGKKGKNTIPYRASKVGKGNYLMRVRSKDKVETTTVVIE